MGGKNRQMKNKAARSPPRRAWVAPLALAAIVFAAWSNSFHGPFILDDMPAITENSTIRNLSDWRATLSPPGQGQTVSGRPVVNLTLAVNWAIGGPSVFGYHIANLLIHLFAALTLFGAACRVFRLPTLRARFGEDARWIAFTLALLWGVHPLQTESVTYIVQRAESLAGLFYLLTLHAFLRAADAGGLPARRRWLAASVAACALGMASKEVMVSAPLVILLADRTLVAGSWRAAWRARRGHYLALAATWGLLIWLVAATGTRGNTAGYGLGISTWEYLLTQCRAIVHYLRLVVWPSPLVLDYGFLAEPSALAVAPQALLLAVLLAVAAAAVWKGWAAGVPAAAFFLLLAPSSSVVPVATQTMAEHRMYLPLAAALALAVGALYARGGRAALTAGLAAAVACAGVTHRRNRDYATDLAIWQDTARKAPDNARAHQELGGALLRAGRLAEALAAYETALRLKPDYPKGRNNYASALCEAGRWAEAAAQYERAVRQLPDMPEPIYGYGNALMQLGRLDGAIASYERAIQLAPNFYPAHNNLANIFAGQGRNAEALAHYDAAIASQPAFPDGYVNSANLLARLNRFDEAIARYERGLRLNPGNLDARANLGTLYIATGQRAEGLRELRAVLRMAPDHPVARQNLENALNSTTTPSIVF